MLPVAWAAVSELMISIAPVNNTEWPRRHAAWPSAVIK